MPNLGRSLIEWRSLSRSAGRFCHGCERSWEIAMSRRVIRVLLASCATIALAEIAKADPVVVTMNTVQIFSTVDPAKISDYTDYMATVNLYDGLVSVDRKGRLIPELAEKWDVSADGKEVTFHIRS